MPAIATRHHYRIEIDFAADCRGANVCSAGSFEAFDNAHRHGGAADLPPSAPRAPDAEDRAAIRARTLILDRPTPLARGLTGYYTESPSAASDGGNSSLWWRDGGIEFSLITRISNRATLAKIADSALRNGRLND